MGAQDWATVWEWIGFGFSTVFSRGGLWAIGSTMAVLFLTKLLYGWR